MHLEQTSNILISRWFDVGYLSYYWMFFQTRMCRLIQILDLLRQVYLEFLEFNKKYLNETIILFNLTYLN